MRLLPLLVIVFAASCARLPISQSSVVKPVNNIADTVTFAIIGDYGTGGKQEGDVAAMVKSWKPEFVITVGDNNYPLGEARTIVKHIGNYYGDFIYNPDAPKSKQCKGKAAEEKVNRFFPAPGNHDNYAWPKLKAYLRYFTLPGDERNYSFNWGPIHFYSLNTGTKGHVEANSEPAALLKADLQQSKQPFKMVYFHHPPYSVSKHGSNKTMQWAWDSLGVNAVLTGHDHVYERITSKDGNKPLYLVCGNSGRELYKCNLKPLDENEFNVFCDDQSYGAVLVKANKTTVVFEYYTIADTRHPKDVYVIRQ